MNWIVITISCLTFFTCACTSDSTTALDRDAIVTAQDLPIISNDDESAPVDVSSYQPIAKAVVGQPSHIGTKPIEFTDVTVELGLVTVGTRSVSFVDFDRDGWPDLVAGTDNGLVFYRNIGGSFVDVTMHAYGGPSKGQQEFTSSLLVDLDNDGNLDLYMGSRSQNDQILFNDGTARWIQPTEGWEIPESQGVQGIQSADVDGDGWLDLYVSSGRRIDIPRGESPEEDGWNGASNVLLLNQQGAGFLEVTKQWNAEAGPFSESFGGVFADFDRDHDVDLVVIRDFRSDHYFQNEGSQFVDASFAAFGAQDTSLMGIAVGDINGDSKLDIFGTNASQDFLYHGNGDGTFTNVYSSAVPVGDSSINNTGWGCALVDFDNDGDLDVISVSSYEYEATSGSKKNPPRIGHYSVLENVGNGTFSNITAEAGLDGPINGWGLAMADYDRDGDVDIAVGLVEPLDNGVGPNISTVQFGLRVLRNDSARAVGNRFLYLDLRHPTMNQWAVGSTVDVFAGQTVNSRVVTAGESYVSQHNYFMHFGLGTHSVADKVHVQWFDGTHTIAHSVPAGAWRLFPSDGHCCHPGQSCDSPWPDCVIEPEHLPAER